MRVGVVGLLTAGLAGCVGVLVFRPAEVRSQSAPPPGDLSQFRIVVGLTDQEARPWQGKITVNGAELAGVEGWRFSQKDRVEADGAFRFQTKNGPFEYQLSKEHPLGQTDWNDPRGRRLIPQGLVVRIRGAAEATVAFESGSGTFQFRAEQVPLGRALNVLDGNGVVERLPVEEKLAEPGRADDYPAIAVAPDGTRWVAWLSYQQSADEVVASGGGRLYRLTGPGDHHTPALASDGRGKVWAVWSQKEGETYQLYAGSFASGDWTKPEALTAGAGSNLWPVLASDGRGRLALTWQGFRRGQSAILARLWDGKKWGAERQISEGAGNCWTPWAAFGGGRLWIVWDSYVTGAYQVYAREWDGGIQRVTRGQNFSVRPSVAVTSMGLPVAAWEESDPLWGKDFAFLYDRRGTVLYKNRRVRVAYREGAEWKEMAAPVEEAVPAAVRRFIQQPALATDGEKLYLSFRCRTSTGTSRIDYWANAGRWEVFLTHLDGQRWAPAIPMPSSVGRNGMRAALVLAKGQAHLAWPTDNRIWPGSRYGDLDVFATAVPLTAGLAQLRGRPMEAGPASAQNPNPNEASDARRVREYRYSMNGKQYRILRGDLHRHTELSGDGAGDGSLDDLYRYELDAAAFDFGYVGDHQMGEDQEYNWWLTQKSNDLYYMPQRFVPLYGYERSVWWPNGHRNIIWAERGKPVLKIGQPEAKGATNSGPILYPYLRETNGIATSHSSATEQGTDWRDNDPELEPLVEIYQGFESSYEHPGAPRTWKEGEKPVHQGLRPLGFIWNAWAKGFKLGVQSSSDHISTHTSIACILAEDFSRQGLVEAMRKRHAYGATDMIILDYRISTADAGTFLMGDIVTTGSEPRLIVKVLGTDAVKRIDVIKNQTYIHKVEPNQSEVSFEYVDRAIQPGESYYYVRVEQNNGQLAWSSPIWVRYKK